MSIKANTTGTSIPISGSLYLSPQQVAIRLNLSYWTVLRHIRGGILPAIRIGRQFRIPIENNRRWKS